MSVERVLASTNVKQIQRILGFYDKLIIKNNVEAVALESENSEAMYSMYKYALTESDNFSDYSFDITTDNQWFTSDEMIHMDKYGLNELLSKEDSRALNFIKNLRDLRVKNYIEHNPYYRPFNGLPRGEDETILVSNEDSGPSKIPIHMVKIDTHPFTYDRLFTKRNVDLIIDQYPQLIYLKFLENPLSPYYVREAPQFTIFSYSKSSLNEQELESFFKSYETMRVRLLTVDYIEGYDDIYSDYSNQMLLVLLYSSFLHFCNSYIEAYSLRNYTDVEIYDILDSYGLGKLKTISINILRKMIMRLPELLVEKGSDQVLDKILDIISEDSIVVKRYYLSKKYRTDNTNHVSFDPNTTYDKNVDLEFIEKIIRGDKSAEPIHIPYHQFVKDDDTWGGAIDAVDAQRKYEIKEQLRREILSMDFSSIITKYINVSKTIEVIEKTARISDMFALMMQLNKRDNFFYNDKVNYDGVEVSPIDLWAAFCWATAKSNNVPSPNIIVADAFSIGDVMYMRNNVGISQFARQVEMDEVELGTVSRTMKIKDILKNVNILDYLVSFGFDNNTSIHEILEQYEGNKNIFNNVLQKIAESTSIAEYNAWMRIRDHNLISERITGLFRGYLMYDSFLAARSPDFLILIKSILTGGDTPTEKESIANLTKKISSAFREYVQNKTSGLLDIPSQRDMASGGDTSLKDIKLLLSEFTSIYTELYKIEFYQGFSDVPYNTINLTYDLVRTVAKLKTREVVELNQGIDKSIHSFRRKDDIFFNEEYKLIHKMKCMTDVQETDDFLKINISKQRYNNKLSHVIEIKENIKSTLKDDKKMTINIDHNIIEL